MTLHEKDLTVFLALCSLLLTGACCATTEKRVAVIGAGIGGSATAFFLSQMGSVKDSKAQIDLIEKTDRIGGRVYAISLHGSKYEAGGSILHSSNHYAESLSQSFGLLHRKDDGLRLMGISDGNAFVFRESSYSAVTLFRLAQRYGMDLLRVQSLVSSMLDHFSRIYIYQEKGVAFEKLQDLLAAMSYKFPSMLSHSFDEHLRNISVSETTRRELVQAISMVNYGQPVTRLHAFVGSVSSAGADFTGSLWNIDGGNEQLPHELAKRSGARLLLETEVKEVLLLPNGAYLVRDSNANEMTYDVIVMAHPLTPSGIQFRGFADSEMELISSEQRRGKYHRTVASFVSGVRSANYLSNELQDVIVCKDEFWFQSISRLDPVSRNKQSSDNSSSSIYKIFSPKPLTSEQLAVLFDRVDDVSVIPWDAYPDYFLLQQQQQPRFLIRPGLFYVNAIEWAASAMEMSLISAKNAALLASQFMYA